MLITKDVPASPKFKSMFRKSTAVSPTAVHMVLLPLISRHQTPIVRVLGKPEFERCGSGANIAPGTKLSLRRENGCLTVLEYFEDFIEDKGYKD
jgi:hypothetical protein